MNSVLSRFLASALLLVCWVDSGRAQSTSNSQPNLSEFATDTFISLRDKRESVVKETDQLEQELRSLRAVSQDRDYWKRDIEDAGQELEEAKKAGAINPRYQASLEKKIQTAREALSRLKSDDEVRKDIDGKEKELATKKAYKNSLELEMNRRIDIEKPKQDFKKGISWVFATLVALVIVLFFYIAQKDDVVRREIFSGQAGIQFVTLFSLVIAVILFGITDVLEGKELSALLGGLSGYILGRGTSGKTP